MISEKFVGFIVISLFALAGYKMMVNADCRQMAVAQNYTADAVKHICR